MNIQNFFRRNIVSVSCTYFHWALFVITIYLFIYYYLLSYFLLFYSLTGLEDFYKNYETLTIIQRRQYKLFKNNSTVTHSHWVIIHTITDNLCLFVKLTKGHTSQANLCKTKTDVCGEIFDSSCGWRRNFWINNFAFDLPFLTNIFARRWK